jgi:RNA polymerase sigma-70 factor (ECF subfamily)
MARIDRFDGEFPAVLAAAQSGAPWGLERIFRALSPDVAGYLRMQGSQEPEDLTSEVFVAVLRKIGTFRGEEPAFRSWVFTIAHRRLIDERRRAVRHAVVTPLAEDVDLPAPDDVADAVLSTLSTERVYTLCEQLVPDQRDVLLLRLIARMTVDEVAELVDKSPGAVKALQRRGFRAVGRILDREGVPL